MSWLDELLKQTADESETPERYFWWSGLAAISAVARKNVWIDRHKYILYPNIYVALISEKSGLRKGIPITICKRLLREANSARIISGTNSIQGIIKELSGQKTLSNGAVISDAHGILLSGEFSAFLTEDPKGLTYLVDLYNTFENEGDWEKTLKSEKSVLKNPCLTMLVASNETLLDTIVKRKDMEGGFVARTFLVWERKASGENALVDPPETPMDLITLSKRLIEISKIKGGFKWTKEAGDNYKAWYHELKQNMPEDRTGTYDRLHDSVLKAAMLISLARKDDLDLEWQDIELAIDKCEPCAESAASITPNSELSNGDKPNVTKILSQSLIDAAINKSSISKMEILNRLQKHQVTTVAVDFYIKELLKLGRISEKQIVGTGHVNSRTFYTLTDEGRDYLIKEAKRKKTS